MITYEHIKSARKRIEEIIQDTPCVTSGLLNRWLGHEIVFKAECLQTTGSFKIRGAANKVRSCLEQGTKFNHLIASSSGNHAQAVAYLAQQLQLDCTIHCAKTISTLKAQATEGYGARLVRHDTRQLADQAVQQQANQSGSLWIHPFNDPDVIAGQGTCVDSVLRHDNDFDALFVPCGGGGLASGSFIAATHHRTDIKVFAAEPRNMDDAARSRELGAIQTNQQGTSTIADGVATPSIGELTFPFIQRLHGVYRVDEDSIMYWSQWLPHLLKLQIEPSCCMCMAAVTSYLKQQTKPQRILVVLSGGNISASTTRIIYQQDRLLSTPRL